MGTIILSVTTFLFLVMYLIKVESYKKISNKMKLLDEQVEDFNKPLRKGHYTIYTVQTDRENDNKKYNVECVIFVDELDRYTSGESKISFTDVNMICNDSGFTPDTMRRFIKDSFRIIRNTNEITWLESEISIKEARKSKLDKIKETLKS